MTKIPKDIFFSKNMGRENKNNKSNISVKDNDAISIKKWLEVNNIKGITKYVEKKEVDFVIIIDAGDPGNDFTKPLSVNVSSILGKGVLFTGTFEEKESLVDSSLFGNLSGTPNDTIIKFTSAIGNIDAGAFSGFPAGTLWSTFKYEFSSITTVATGDVFFSRNYMETSGAIDTYEFNIENDPSSVHSYRSEDKNELYNQIPFDELVNYSTTGVESILGGRFGGGLFEENITGGPQSTQRVGSNNSATGTYGSTVSGGLNNTASNYASTVGGGMYNTSSGPGSTVGGGGGNTASNDTSTVGGGYGNISSGYISTVGGGYRNTASGDYSTLGGGYNNTASAYISTVGGGYNNNATSSASTIGGGLNNTASGNYASTVSGGVENTASNIFATVGGGLNNTASSTYSTIGGGYGNISSGSNSIVGGGRNNTASGHTSTIGGGFDNTASGINSSVLGGRYNNTSTFANSHIIGSNITSDRADTTFVESLSIKSIPTASAGLPSGSVWSNAGVLNIV